MLVSSLVSGTCHPTWYAFLCLLACGAGVVVRIRNPSALPQAFGCTNLPAGIGVFPNHGFGYILPGEALLCMQVEGTASFSTGQAFRSTCEALPSTLS